MWDWRSRHLDDRNGIVLIARLSLGGSNLFLLACSRKVAYHILAGRVKHMIAKGPPGQEYLVSQIFFPGFSDITSIP